MASINHKRRATPPETWFITGWIPFGIIGTESELHAMREYLKLVERHITAQAVAFVASVDARVEELGLVGEDADYHYESQAEEYDRLHGTYPSVARASVLALTCSRVESALTEICRDFELGNEVTTATTWDATDGKGIQRAARFLRANFDIRPAEHASWAKILQFYKIRDCFMHAGGEIDLMAAGSRTGKDQRAEVRAAIKALPGISEKNGAVVLEGPFFDQLFDTMLAFWSDLREAFRQNAVIGPVYWP